VPDTLPYDFGSGTPVGPLFELQASVEINIKKTEKTLIPAVLDNSTSPCFDLPSI
jgi:hypothetical protein